MPYAGQIIDNPISGERIEFLRTASASGCARSSPRPATPSSSPPGACTSSPTPAPGRRAPACRSRRRSTWRNLFTSTAELAHEGKVLRSGMPKPLHLALFVKRFRREVRAPLLPTPIVHAVLAPLAASARRRGHETRYATLRPALA